jgi:hypothetical protein
MYDVTSRAAGRDLADGAGRLDCRRDRELARWYESRFCAGRGSATQD